MIVAAFAAAVVAVAVWLAQSVRERESSAELAMRLAWQLAALSFLSAPESLVDDRGEVGLQVALAALAAVTLIVGLIVGDEGIGAVRYTPWLAVYGLVLGLAAAFSSNPDVAALRGLRAFVLFTIFGLTAIGLDRAVLRRLFSQFTAGLTLVVALGPLVAGGEAFHPLRAPVVRWALRAPIVGSGPHIVAAIGFGLILATAWRWFDGDRPPPGTRRWLLGLALPATAGSVLLLAAQKRAFWLALAVVVVTWLVLCRRRWLLPTALAIAVAATALLTVGPLRDLWDRERSRPQIDNVASVRTAIFEASLDRFAERPLIGDGLGVGNRDLLIDVGQVGLGWSSHSEVGAALAATGLIGLVVVAWGHVTGFGVARATWRDRGDPVPLLVVAGSVALLPFWRILQEPLLVGLPYYTIVLPLHDWRPIGRPRRWAGLARSRGRS